jgi:phage gpG-like protein
MLLAILLVTFLSGIGLYQNAQAESYSYSPVTNSLEPKEIVAEDGDRFVWRQTYTYPECQCGGYALFYFDGNVAKRITNDSALTADEAAISGQKIVYTTIHNQSGIIQVYI